MQTKVLSAGLIFFFLIVFFCFSLISFINKNVFNGLNSLMGLRVGNLSFAVKMHLWEMYMMCLILYMIPNKHKHKKQMC